MIGAKKIKKGQIETYTTADIADSVDKRYQTDNQQTYNDATSSIQTQLNAKIASTSWIDYSATSTIVGFSSFTTKEIRYKIIDNYMFVGFNIAGVSNTTGASFTVPNNNSSGFIQQNASGNIANNNNNLTTPGRVEINNNSNIITVYRDMVTGVFISSGNKTISGIISFKIN